MYIRKTILASAVALVLASTSSVMAENAPFNGSVPIDELPLIEAAPDGLFIGAPVIHNMNIMIVQVFNNQNELVLNVRSKGEPVELLAAGLPDGEYFYQVKTIYQLNMPTGEGADHVDEGFSREVGSFTISNSEILQPEKSRVSEDLSFIDTFIDGALAIVGKSLSSIIPDATALDLFADSSSPRVNFDDTTSSSSTDWVIKASAASGNGAGEWQLVDHVGFNSLPTTVIDINTLEASAIAHSWAVSSNGDMSWANNSMFLDKSTSELSLGTTLAPSALNLWDTSPDIRFHDETDTSEVEWELDGSFMRLWARTTDVAAWTIPFAAHVDAPTDSLLIDSAGDISFLSNIHFDTDASPTLNIGGAASTGQTLHLEGSDPELVITGTTHGVEIEGYGSQGLRVHMDTDGDGVSNVHNVFGIANAAPQNSMRIDASGKMGLGLASPTEALDMLKTDAAARLKMTSVTSTGNEAPQVVWRRARSAGGSPSGILLNDNIGIFSFRGHDGSSYSGSRALINVTAAQNWAAGAHGTEMVFQTTPNNTSAPAEVMRITNDGKVKINGITLNVPDYVFEEDYELMTLDQLSAYIKENKHLPGVASANEVNTEGLDLAGSQLSVLEKVEELTLYTLQQHEELKQVTALKAAHRELLDENAQLKAAHRELLTAFHSQQEKLDKVDQLEQMVNEMMQSQEGKSVYTSLK